MIRSVPKVQLNIFDQAIAFFFPGAGVRRLAARSVLSQYEAAKPSRLRKGRKANGSPNAGPQMGAVGLRGLARHLASNHDIARGALRTLVNNVVGPSGIGIEPQPRRRDGSIHAEYAAALRTAYRNWAQTPEVTQRHHWSKVQRVVAKTWLRDGECFSQRLIGAVPLLDHATKVPYSLELIEPDLIPSITSTQRAGSSRASSATPGASRPATGPTRASRAATPGRRAATSSSALRPAICIILRRSTASDRCAASPSSPASSTIAAASFVRA